MKKWLKIILLLIGTFLLVVSGYLGYVFLSYHRIADNVKFKCQSPARENPSNNTNYRALTYNIGYASYPPTYSFFMGWRDTIPG